MIRARRVRFRQNYQRQRWNPLPADGAMQRLDKTLGKLVKPSRAARVQGARSTGTAVYIRVHEDSEHRATTQSGRAAGFNRFRSVEVGLGVMHIELAGRGDDAWILDHRLELAGLEIGRAHV